MSRIAHVLGSALALAGIVFVGFQVAEYSSELDFSRFNSSQWTLIGVLALIYGLANFLLVAAWWNLLKLFGVQISGMQAVKITGATQIAKYVPGNIFHLVSRQALGMSQGIPSMPLAKSALWEIGLIAGSALLLGIFTLNLLLPHWSLLICSAVYFATLTISLMVFKHVIGTAAVRAIVFYNVFLAVTGLLFIVLIDLVVAGDWQASDFWLPLGAAYILSWLLGLVTPGAPAGIGVRELVLTVLLQDLLAGPDLMLAVLLGRLTTVGGDLAFFFVSSLFRDRTDTRADSD